MNYIKGKYRNIIFDNGSGYKVGLFRIKETNDDEMNDFLNKTVTFTGYFGDLNEEDTYIFYGELINHHKFGYQYQVNSYEKIIPEGKDAVIEFLSSPLIRGCGEKTAMAIVDTLGEDAIDKIKENKSNLLLVPNIGQNKADKIYESLMKYSGSDDTLIYLQGLGFNNKEALNLFNEYGISVQDIIEKDIYELKEIIDFKKLDVLYLRYGKIDDEIRSKACIIETMKRITFNNGDTYNRKEEIYDYMKSEFKILLSDEEFSSYLSLLIDEQKIVEEDNKYYLFEYYEYEEIIADNLMKISLMADKEHKALSEVLTDYEKEFGIKYSADQRKAVMTSLKNRVTIITGGPGTGKTTIINGIVKMYCHLNKLSPEQILSDIALIAPTGRASKKMSESTNLPAMTIHRYLKWNQDKNTFAVDKYNKNKHKLIVVDEVSMIDTHLMASLLEGINTNVQLILVGDANQLPSVGPGMILTDLIDSDKFMHISLTEIYRQSENSYIPYLAEEIKNKTLSEYKTNHDDYSFIFTPSSQIKNMIKQICIKSLEKGIDEDKIQVLAPMYKGENGIDNLNIMLQNLFNKKSSQKEIQIGTIVFRENDKVLQLVNDPDNNIFNGDIGYIEKVLKPTSKNKNILRLNFDGNRVEYNKEECFYIKHAYAISIHKSQGSEFDHIIMPISKNYHRMLYNKLIYTGVSRAKKSLILLGEENAFLMAINNDYSKLRKTGLKDKLMYK